MMSDDYPRSKLSDRIAGQLRESILRGELPAWSKLPTESELGEMFGVSRTAIRDAMRTLSASGLVEIQHGRGMVVASPSDGPFADALVVMLLRSNLTVGDVLDARAVIDAGVGPIAATRATADDLDRLAGDLDTFSQAADGADWEAAQRAHDAFHLSLLSATHMPAIEIVLRPLQHLVLLTSFPPRSEAEFWELPAHRRILDSLRMRDEQQLRQALVDHYRVMETDSYQQLRKTIFRDSPGVGRILELTKHTLEIDAPRDGAFSPTSERRPKARPAREGG
jgi:DNA-binding FadR family transcriptional regulator